MDLRIFENVDLQIFNGSEKFLVVKRKGFIVTYSMFYKNEALLLRLSTWCLFHFKFITIKSQNLGSNIEIIKQNNQFYLYNNEDVYFIEMDNRLLRKSNHQLYFNDNLIGSIQDKSYLQMAEREYLMETSSEDEFENLNFLILFISQILT